jgi:hypothetical protein
MRHLLLVPLCAMLGTQTQAAARLLDPSKLDGMAEVPPVEARTLDTSSGTGREEVRIVGSMVFDFEVTDPVARYRISLRSPERVSLTLELMQLELNEAGQPTARDVLATRSTSNADARSADLPDMLLRPGRYYLGIAALREVDAVLEVAALPPVEQPESLPDRVENAVVTGNDVAGIWKGETRCLRPQALADGAAVDLLLLRPPDSSAELVVYDGDRRDLAERSGTDQIAVRNLQGPQLRVCIELGGRNAADAGWRLITEPTDFAGYPLEPDDAREAPGRHPLALRQPVEAPLDVGDVDRFSMPAAPPGQALQLKLESAVPVEACLREPDDDAECYRGRRLEIGPFAGGETELAIEHQSDRSGRYRLTLDSVPFDDDTMVLEPNDAPGTQPLVPSSTRVTGELANAQDVDVIGFDAGAEAAMWRIVVLGEGVSQVYVYNDRGAVADLRRANGGRRLTTPDLYLDPGGAFLRLTGSPGPYKVILKPLGPPRPNDEREPNEDLPRRLVPGVPVVGTLPQGDDDDFAFFLDRDAPVRFAVDVPAGGRFRLETFSSGGAPTAPELYRTSVEAGGWSRQALLPAGEHLVQLEPQLASPAEYRLLVDYADPFPVPQPPGVEVAVAAPEAVRAFSVFRQQVDLPVTLTNPGPEAVAGTVQTWFARHGVTQAPVAFSLAAGATATSTVPVTLPADLYTGDLTGFVAANRNDGGVLGSTRTRIRAVPEQPPVNRQPAPPAPAAMIGGINLAQSALGARWLDSGPNRVDPETGDYAEDNPARASDMGKAIDGFIVQGRGAYRHAGYLARDGREPLAPILELPGEAPVPVVGVGIDTRMTRAVGLRRFAVDVSSDGADWQEVLQATHDTWGRTAYYEFPDGVVEARRIRLRALDRRGDEGGDIAISAFEVIAEPGGYGADTLNIADRRLGALVTGWQDTRGGLTTQIDPDEVAAERFDADGVRTDFNLAITFKNQMRAQIGAVELVYPEALPGDDYPWAIEAVLSISPRGPGGPWREIARFELPQTPQPGQVVRHELAEWATAAAVKIDYVLAEPARFHGPGLIRVLERPEDRTYRSVLGLWGEYASVRVEPQEDLAAGHGEVAPDAAPRDIEADGSRHEGLAEFQQLEQTWRIGVGPDDNIVRLFVAGSPGFEPSVRAAAADGTAVEPLSVEREPFADETRYEFAVTDGGPLDVTVSEDARSTVFLFDQSPSVAPYIPVIRRAIVDFAEAMVEGRDGVQFKSLGGNWAREAWYTDANNLRRALATYRGDDRSSAEAALIDAARLLETRDGSRAIVIITDGDGSAEPALPGALAAADARVFVIKISSGGGTFADASVSQPLVAAWAGQTGGQVNPVLKGEDVAVGYARASARLLGPKAYSLRAAGDYRPLEPGFLTVSTPAAGIVADPADGMLIIADASGSMLKRLEDGRRITVARRALKTFVAAMAGDAGQVPMGLRVFGGAPHSCDTELVRPVGSHAAAALLADIDAIDPRNNARTAIGAALEAAVADLQAVSGARSVLLVTDGEETCDGDPMAAVSRLREAFPDTRVDVVTFALEGEIDRRPFQRWAAAGGGIYVDAADGATLTSALQAAMRVRFDVVREGEVVASGAAGAEPIALAPGEYELVIDGTRQPLRISSGQTSRVEWTAP